MNIFSGAVGLLGLLFNKKWMFKNYLIDFFRKAPGINHSSIPSEFYDDVLDEILYFAKFSGQDSLENIMGNIEFTAVQLFSYMNPDLYGDKRCDSLFGNETSEIYTKPLDKYNISWSI